MRRSPYWTVGRFASWKGAGEVQWESPLERDFLYHLEYSRVVNAYREQPITVQLRVNGCRRRYTPDFYAEQRNGRFVYEVKPRNRAGRSEYADLFRAADEHFSNNGLIYRVVTEEWIRREPLLENLKILVRYRTKIIPSDLIDRARAILSCGEVMTVSELASEISPKRPSNTPVYQLLWARVLRASINIEPLGPDAVVWCR